LDRERTYQEQELAEGLAIVVAESMMAIESPVAAMSEQSLSRELLTTVMTAPVFARTFGELLTALHEGQQAIIFPRRRYVVLRILLLALWLAPAAVKGFSPEIIAIAGLLADRKVEYCQKTPFLQSCVKITPGEPQ
jgi:hypothetical protein